MFITHVGGQACLFAISREPEAEGRLRQRRGVLPVRGRQAVASEAARRPTQPRILRMALRHSLPTLRKRELPCHVCSIAQFRKCQRVSPARHSRPFTNHNINVIIRRALDLAAI